RAFDDDLLGRDINADPTGMINIGPGSPVTAPPRAAGPENPYFREVFDQFVALKKSCGEPTAGLTYAKFAEKLVKNRDDLMAKTNCKEVRFTVYVKDGKAALKATPVKDE
ncbi:MAG: MXAN_5187 C-terminal domain-containing protein, partial [Polyangiales bacterium]